jgi:threonine/homoserine/homoserine lactone efflux protein
MILLILAAVILAGVSFCATSTWAIFGTAIKSYLHNPRLKAVINILLSLSLVYTAITLIGLF